MGCGCDPRTGRCFDPEDEGPSDADLARFGSETIECPECGADVYDDSAACQRCGRAMGDAGGEPAPGKLKLYAGTAVALLALFVVAVVLRFI